MKSLWTTSISDNFNKIIYKETDIENTIQQNLAANLLHRFFPKFNDGSEIDKIRYIAFGSGSDDPESSDKDTLQNELFRVIVNKVTLPEAINQVIFSYYYENTTDSQIEIKERGLVISSDENINTGYLANRLVTIKPTLKIPSHGIIQGSVKLILDLA